MKHSILADSLSTVNNAEEVGKEDCMIPCSNLVLNLMKTMQRKGYIGEFELIEDNKGNKLRVKLKGKINECKAIRPHFSVQRDEFEKWEKRYLPAKGLGHLIVSTSRGIMTQEEAKDEKIGGKLVGYVY